jgi:hypothetical protein
MARHWFNSGHNDRKAKKPIISSACVGGRGGVIKPYVASPFRMSDAELDEMERTVERLERSVRGQIENRLQDERRRREE